MKNLNLGEFAKFGIGFSGSKMDNGELRFRLYSSESSYIRTEMRGIKGWQKSHYHNYQKEIYFIEKGKVILATFEHMQVEMKSYFAGDTFFVKPGIPHNIFMDVGTITHTIKSGGIADWNAAPYLDEHLKLGDDNG